MDRYNVHIFLKWFKSKNLYQQLNFLYPNASKISLINSPRLLRLLKYKYERNEVSSFFLYLYNIENKIWTQKMSAMKQNYRHHSECPNFNSFNWKKCILDGVWSSL